jgi:membrane protein
MADDVRNAGPDDPGDLPKRSWGATLKRTFSEFKDDNVTDWAAALTYYGLLALFPAIAALVSIVGLVFSPSTITRVLTDTLTSIGPKSSIQTFQGPINQVTGSKQAAGLGVVVGIALSLWSASGYIGAFIRASNAIYEREEGRGFFKLRPVQLLVTLILVLLAALIVVALIVSGPLASAIGGAVGLGSTAVTVWNIAKWPVMLVVVMVMLAILYYASPNAKQPKFKWISPGAIVAVIVWVIASALFAFYVANFSSYNKTYGTLGGVISFLVWLWITNIAVLFGLELNAEMEREREIVAGVPGAEEDIQLPYRAQPEDAPEKNGRFERGEQRSQTSG